MKNLRVAARFRFLGDQHIDGPAELTDHPVDVVDLDAALSKHDHLWGKRNPTSPTKAEVPDKGNVALP